MLKRIADRLGLHAHWQNLNEGRLLSKRRLHGRAWLHFGDDQVSVEWMLPSGRLNIGVAVSTDGDDTFVVHACVPPVGLHFGVETGSLGRRLSEFVERYGLMTKDDWGGYHREFSLRVFDWAVWWNMWRNPHHGRLRDRRNNAWHPFGFPGSRVGEPEIVEQRTVDVPMPEGPYRAKATLSRIVARGKRWPILRDRLTIVDLEFREGGSVHGVPSPRKGPIWSTSTCAESIEGAIGEFVGRTMLERTRYGGENWRPESEVEAVEAS